MGAGALALTLRFADGLGALDDCRRVRSSALIAGMTWMVGRAWALASACLLVGCNDRAEGDGSGSGTDTVPTCEIGMWLP